MRTAAMVLMPVPAINPKKDPKAALRDEVGSFLAYRSSARKAPRKEPAIIPTGVSTIPAIRPIIAPLSAYLLPPVIFVKYIGTI